MAQGRSCVRLARAPVLAIKWEERDLAREHGDPYENYRRSVPMLVPFARRQASAADSRRRREQVT